VVEVVVRLDLMEMAAQVVQTLQHLGQQVEAAEAVMVERLGPVPLQQAELQEQALALEVRVVPHLIQVARAEMALLFTLVVVGAVLVMVQELLLAVLVELMAAVVAVVLLPLFQRVELVVQVLSSSITPQSQL
jgi:hypothetical protein